MEKIGQSIVKFVQFQDRLECSNALLIETLSFFASLLSSSCVVKYLYKKLSISKNRVQEIAMTILGKYKSSRDREIKP